MLAFLLFFGVFFPYFILDMLFPAGEDTAIALFLHFGLLLLKKQIKCHFILFGSFCPVAVNCIFGSVAFLYWNAETRICTE